MGQGSPIGQILERWNQIPRGRQMALAGIVGGTIVVLYFVFIASSSPNMVTAYSSLEPEDAAAIAAELQKSGIAYDLGANGTSISVAAEKVGEARIKLASAGLPRNGASIGFEVFDKTNFGATDYVQQVNYQRALEGELARSINSIESVKASRVHLVMPKDSVFKEDQEKTTASVLLDLKSGRDLTQDQVRGITNLVSNSVPGLASGGVTIMDQTGHVLFDGSTFDNPFSTGASGTQMDLQRKYETALARDVQTTLDKVVGAGRSAVTVRAKLNFDTVTSKEDTFGTAASVVPRSSSSVTETFNGSNLNVGNVPGTGTNGATDTGTGTTANGNSTYSRTETTTNNEVPKTEKTTVKAPGTLDRLSVSVVLDESVTAAQEQALTSAVAAAVGIDQTRGDTLNVARLPFDASVREDLVSAASSGLGQYLQYLKLILPMLAVVLAFVLVTLLLKSLNKRQGMLTAPQHQQLALAAAAAIPSRALAPGVPLPALESAPDPMEERVHTLASQNPRAVADVVQTWMREEDA